MSTRASGLFSQSLVLTVETPGVDLRTGMSCAPRIKRVFPGEIRPGVTSERENALFRGAENRAKLLESAQATPSTCRYDIVPRVELLCSTVGLQKHRGESGNVSYDSLSSEVV
jgi:hypothetical protein